MDNIRDERYDFYKGLLMIGVIFGHVLTALQAGYGKTVWIHEFIRTYDMPMFAFISGIFIKKSCEKRDPVKNILNKVGGVLLPALIWSELFALISGRLILSTGGLWFLFASFLSSIIIILIDQVKNITIQILCFIAVIVLFHTLIIDSFMTGFLLAPAVFGYYYEKIMYCVKTRLQEKTRKIYSVVIFLAFVLAQCFWKTDYNVWTLGCNILNNGAYFRNSACVLYRFVIGILGCIVMKNIFDILYKILAADNSKESHYILCKILVWGRETLELYILHAWFVSVAGAKVISILVSKLGSNPFVINKRLLVLLIAPLITMATLYCMHFFSNQIKRIPVLGKHLFSIKIQ